MAKESEEKSHDNSFGVASVVLGILGIVFSSINGVILGIVGLVFARKQLKINKNKWGRTGKILGIIAIILGVITFAVMIYYSVLTNPEFMAALQAAGNNG